jgi:DNA-binding transcriptional regulator YiaG
MPEPWASLVRAAGSVEAVAALCRVTVRTLRRWAHGVATPNGPTREYVRAVFQQRGFSPPWSGR